MRFLALPRVSTSCHKTFKTNYFIHNLLLPTPSIPPQSSYSILSSLKSSPLHCPFNLAQIASFSSRKSLFVHKPNSFRFIQCKQYSNKTSSVCVEDGASHKHNSHRSSFSFGLLGFSLLAFGLYFSSNRDNFTFAYIVAKRSCISAKAAILVSYNYYFHFPQLLDDQAQPEEIQKVLEQRSRTHKKCAEIVRDAMLQNGGVYIKLGQHVAAMDYVLPSEWTSTMVPLQDKCISSSIESINKLFLSEYGLDLSQYFEWFAPDPIGVASLAQVHKAKLLSTGQIVAVKVQHSDVLTYSYADIGIVTRLFSLVYKLFPDFQFMWLADEMNLSLPVELDFRNEENNSIKLAHNFMSSPDIPLVVPKVLSSTKRVLIMEFMDGHRVDDLNYILSNHINPAQVSREIARIYGKMTFIDGFVHCDPHPGNLFIRPSPPSQSHSFLAALFRPSRPNFDLVLLDHGLYRTLSPEFTFKYALLWRSLIKGDVAEIRRQSFDLTGTDLYVMLSCIITGQSWDSISEGKLNQAPVNISFDQDQLFAQNDRFFYELSKILSSIPRDLVLMIKTNDLIRQIDRALFANLSPSLIHRATLKSWIILSEYCISALKRMSIQALFSSPSPSPSSLLSHLLGLYSRLLFIQLDYWSFHIPISAYFLWLSFLDFIL
ncbi:putative aarF domain-containing protein kinase 1 [Smittium mucronatum]|uniref:Putative aarF domain-containing protein kinase 1 n=1 Tax=Smittium mucronatum TaxID=133383 RepID=A0A1R0GU96_9FUNG|nr:putative aarF domain-containing protein kinase 1 [Smittium mucronatum]